MNENVKGAARMARVPLWEIAERLGISESTMTRMLRRELTAEKQSELVEVIHTIARERVI